MEESDKKYAGKYLLQYSLGKGILCESYRALNTDDGKQYIIKRYPKSLVPDNTNLH